MPTPTRTSIVLGWFFLFSSSMLQAQGTFPAAKAVDRAVMVEMQRQHLVGVSIGIIRGGKVVYTRGYGFADLPNNRPVTEASIFNWASNSKPVIAIAAMQLVQADRLDLDEPIAAYLPDLPQSMSVLTTRQLLCHQSGIPHYSNGKVVRSGKSIDAMAELDPLYSIHRFLNSPLIFEPGSKTDYSSYAYVLLSAVIQAADKKPISQQLKQRIVEPLKLRSFQLDVPYQGQENWVTSYKYNNSQPLPVEDYAHYWKHGAGGYKSDVRDFARFAVGLIGHALVSSETTRMMWTPQKTFDGQTSSYGLGFVVQGDGERLKISHNGSQNETKTRMVIYPNQKHGVVVMCNTSPCDVGKISTTIYKAIKTAQEE